MDVTTEVRWVPWSLDIGWDGEGVGLFIWGSSQQNQRAAENNRLYDLELDQITLRRIGTADNGPQTTPASAGV